MEWAHGELFDLSLHLFLQDHRKMSYAGRQGHLISTLTARISNPRLFGASVDAFLTGIGGASASDAFKDSDRDAATRSSSYSDFI